jgi:hypothetical protein|tara:strand:- start:1315 stop:1464 length:150 start_codon:yes stop_codon:yes gene_type:complete
MVFNFRTSRKLKNVVGVKMMNLFKKDYTKQSDENKAKLLFIINYLIKIR